MRYFVLAPGDGVAAHIVAEVVRESFDDGSFREVSLASALCGEGSRIVKSEELMNDALGRRALAAWVRGNDMEFDHETERILARIRADESERHIARLRVVRDPSEAESAGPARDEIAIRSELLERAARSVREARLQVAIARERRLRLAEARDALRYPTYKEVQDA
jgi:hypothetical protein